MVIKKITTTASALHQILVKYGKYTNPILYYTAMQYK